MLSLTHQNARYLLQRSLDAELNAPEQATLAAHLAACPECSAYAQKMTGLEAQLRHLTHQQWDRPAPRLSTRAIRQPLASPRPVWGAFLNVGLPLKLTAAAALVITLMFAFNLGGLQRFTTLPVDVSSAPAPATLLQTPTPAIRETSTLSSLPNCQFATHIVREAETLDEIAARYGVSVIRLMEVNRLQNAPLIPGQALAIPVCVTPTSTSTTSPTPRD